LAKQSSFRHFLGVRMLGIISSFDGGNIEVVKADDPSDIQLKIRSDTNAEFFQWFYFRVVGVRR
jgi:murein tripeptide amidase MpaA